MEGIDPAVGFLRHALATLAYRADKVLRGAPPDFGPLRIGPSTRTPVEILAHIGDLLDWSLSLAAGQHVWKKSTPQSWEAEVDRFFETLSRLDQRLAGAGLACSAEKLFQGPVADALTHVGQIAMLRRVLPLPPRTTSRPTSPSAHLDLDLVRIGRELSRRGIERLDAVSIV